MKNKLLFVSVGLNVVLATWIVRTASVAAPPAVISLPSQVVETAAPEEFSWSKLESVDGQTYVANLRQAGCPEQTIVSIMQQRVEDLFAAKRAPVVARIEAANATDPGRKVADAELRSIKAEENRLLGQFLGTAELNPPDLVAQLDPPVRRRPAGPSQVFNPAPTMPLVFQAIDNNRVGLNSEEISLVEKGRQTFSDALGTNPDITSPDYATKWQQAQQNSDDWLSAMLGREAWMRYYDEAHRLAAP